MLFYTGFPNYEALMSFHNYIELKVRKIQYWKREKLLNESWPYQMDKNKSKAGFQGHSPTFKSLFLSYCDWRQDCLYSIFDRFGISTSLVLCICITWINFLSAELPGLFPFPLQELVIKNMPQEFAEYLTTRIILDCSEVCWHNLKLGHIINTITHGKCQWLSLKMARCLSFQTCGENRFQTNKLLEKAVFSFVRAWWQYHGWQGIWYFWCHAKWCNSKRASFLGWKGSDDWGGN